MRELPPRPETIEELKSLVDAGDIEILLSEEIADGTTHLLVQDNRRTFEEGELYEIVV